MAFKFVHTADIHLDSPLKSLALRDPALADLIGTATRTAFARTIDLCLSETVQALIIAGDLYDGGQTSMKTARFLAQQLGRLAAAGIPAFIIRGNHDAMSRITRELVLPDIVHVFGGRAETVQTDWNGHPVAVHGLSFRQPQAPDSLLEKFGAPVPGAFNIGILHTSLGGAPGHDLYAPCSVADLQRTGFDYWALGHIHRRAVHAGTPLVVMPGIPQGRDIGEAGETSVTLVRVGDDGTPRAEARDVATARFARAQVDCHGAQDWADLVERLHRALQQMRRDADDETLIVRPVLDGATTLAWRARRDADLLLAEAQTSAETIGSLWIDSLSVDLEAEGGDRPAGALGDLAALVEDSVPAAADPAVRDELARLQKHLPPALRGLWGDDADETARALDRAMRTGARDVLARLTGSSTGRGD
ncbi:MAG: metallophosphoesterase family protein [Marinibacterium sp.]